MSDQQQPRGVHLNGSVPLNDAAEVFRLTSTILGDHLHRIPDGETGARTNWIVWQGDVFARNPFLEQVPPPPNSYVDEFVEALPRFRVRSGVRPEDIAFDQLGYAEAALASYRLFSQLKEEGIIPRRCHFQVSLPTPLAPVSFFVDESGWEAVLPPYILAMTKELDSIASGLPHNELAIQWDVAMEFALLEGSTFTDYAHAKEGILAQLLQWGNLVPEDVELGYHLCYGDAGHKHFVEPQDTTKLVEIANGISQGLKRSLNWISMPVPRNRSDIAYFEPLKNLQLHPETELYLGLVHFTDGVEGTRKRIKTALRVIPNFGVATECGLGRRPAETVPALLQIHREVAAAL